MDTLIIVNPTAGASRAATLWREHGADAARALQADVAFTEGRGHAAQLARDAVQAGCRRLAVVGGDGTLHEVVNGALPGSTEIAVVPVGTGNDFARCAGVPRDPRRALFGLASGRVATLDLGRVGTDFYLHVAGVGFDAAVAAHVNAQPRHAGGTGPYVRATLATLRSHRNGSYRIALDEGEEDEHTCALIAVGNAPAYAGGMRICPRARMDDGLLDVCEVGDVGRLGLLCLLPAVFGGLHVHHPRVRCRRARSVRIDGPTGTPVHADGEPAGPLPLTFGVAPGALRLWLPA